RRDPAARPVLDEGSARQPDRRGVLRPSSGGNRRRPSWGCASTRGPACWPACWRYTPHSWRWDSPGNPGSRGMATRFPGASSTPAFTGPAHHRDPSVSAVVGRRREAPIVGSDAIALIRSWIGTGLSVG